MGIPAYNANFDVSVTPSFPLAGSATVTWTNPTTNPDHWRVYKQSVVPQVPSQLATPLWSASLDISGPLAPGTRNFTFPISNDGSGNFVWVVGWDAGETTANKIFPVQFSAQLLTVSGTMGTLWPTGDFSSLAGNGPSESIPWVLNAQNGGQFQAQATFAFNGQVSGSVPTYPIPVSSSAGFNQAANGSVRTNVITAPWPPFGQINTPNDSDAVGLTTTNNTHGNGVVQSSGALPLPTSPMVFSFTGNFSPSVPAGQSFTLAASINGLAINYISPIAFNNSGGAGSGQGGGGNLAPAPPPTANTQSVPLGLIGGGDIGGATVPLPCIPCCETVMGQPSPIMEGKRHETRV